MCLHPVALALQLLHKYRVKLARKLMPHCSHAPPNVTEKAPSKFQFLKRTGLNATIKEKTSNEEFLY